MVHTGAKHIEVTRLLVFRQGRVIGVEFARDSIYQ